jgi:molybdate transport system substrate-binding protein
LYAQIKNGAPFSVFLAADMKRPKMLVNEGMTVADSLLTYAIGQLVLWSPQADFVDSSGKVLNSDKFKHLAIAHPKMAPYGTAAKQVLEKLGLWQRLQSKMVRGNNISQAYQFTATGNAELGFIALSQYQIITKKSRGSHWLVDKTLYDPIRQGAVLLKKGENNPAALSFMAFLRNPSARQIIETFGYEVP